MKYKYKTRPYVHQVKALKKLLKTGFGGALLMEPRTGKTKTAIDWFSILAKAGKARRILILCPVSVMGVWEDEIALHCPYKTNIVIWDRDNRKSVPLPESRKALNITILNYDAFSVSDKRARGLGRKGLREALRKWAPDVMILDESHRIKSPGARKTYMIWSIAWEFGRSRVLPRKELVPYRLIMTGTPVTKRKRVFDIYSQWKFLNPYRFQDLGTFDLFKDEFGVWTDRNGYPQWLRNRNEEELRKRISKDSYMVKRADCFDLPPSIPQNVPVTLSERTYKAYAEMEAEMLTALANGEISTASIKLVQGLRLAQLTSGLAKAENGKLYVLGDEKLRTTEDLLRDLIEADEKVVIAARFRGDHARLAALGRRLRVPVYRVVGGQGRRERDLAIRSFRAKGSAALMLVQPQAASLGIDLSTASTMIWYSLTTSFVDFSQTCDRIALAKQSTAFYYLLAEGPEGQRTVDHDIKLSLESDGELANIMLERYKSLSDKLA